MIDKTPNNDYLDNYLMGKLSADEQAAMDHQLAADSQLQEEMFLQRDIVQALQEERRLELKNRLNNIEVGAGGFSTAVGLKIAAGVALVGMLGTGIFFYLQHTPEQQDKLPVGIIELPQENTIATYTIPAFPESTSKTEDIPAAVAESQEENLVVDAPAANKKVKAESTTQALAAPAHNLAQPAEETKEAATRPEVQVQKPKVVSEFKDNDLALAHQQLDTPVDAMARNRQFSTQTIDVTAQQHQKWDFHYQFFDSKLFIYGDFKSKPYEILEINTDGSTAYYLYFEKHYYSLKSDQQKLTRLRKINNDKLIKELDITRNQKVNPKN